MLMLQTKPTAILVMGLPATGKTTLARKLAIDLRLPLLAKDAIKELLFDNLGWKDHEWSMRLGHAAYRLLDHLVEQQLVSGRSFILESTFDPKYDDIKWQKWQAKFPFHCIQLLCHADGKILFERYRDRENSEERHPGHKGRDIEWLEQILLAGKAPLLDIAADTLTVDTSDFLRVSYTEILARVHQLLAERDEKERSEAWRHFYLPG